MKKNKIAKMSLAVLSLTLLVGMTSEAAVKKVTITKPTSKSSYTMNRSKKNVTTTIKATVSVTKKSKKTLKYKSSNTKVLTVSSKGKVTAKAPGKATVTVTSAVNSKIKDTIKITVKQRVTGISAGSIDVAAGKKATIKYTVSPSNASSKAVTFKSSNTKIATVSSKGVVTGKKAGKAKITITAKDGSKVKRTINVDVKKKSVTSVSVSPSSRTLEVKGTVTLKSTVKPSGASTDVTYKSSNTRVATVDSKGKVTAKAPGRVTITVTAADGSKKSGRATITVIQSPTALTVSPASMTLYTSGTTTGRITTRLSPSTVTEKTITYTSSNTRVATVSTSGVVTAKGEGTARITVKTKNNLTRTVAVTVLPVQTLEINPDKYVQGTSYSFGVAANSYTPASLAGFLNNLAKSLYKVAPLTVARVGKATVEYNDVSYNAQISGNGLAVRKEGTQGTYTPIGEVITTRASELNITFTPVAGRSEMENYLNNVYTKMPRLDDLSYSGDITISSGRLRQTISNIRFDASARTLNYTLGGNPGSVKFAGNRTMVVTNGTVLASYLVSSSQGLITSN